MTHTAPSSPLPASLMVGEMMGLALSTGVLTGTLQTELSKSVYFHVHRWPLLSPGGHSELAF